MTQTAMSKIDDYTAESTRSTFQKEVADWLDRWKDAPVRKTTSKVVETPTGLTSDTVKQTVKEVTEEPAFKGLTYAQILKEKQRVAREVGGPTLANALKGDEQAASRKMALTAIWADLDNALAQVSPEVKQLNHDMTLAYAIKEPLERALEKPALKGINPFYFWPALLGGTPGTTVLAQVANFANKAAEGIQAARGLK